MEKERLLGDKIQFSDIALEVAGVYPKVMYEGEMDVGAWSCGMAAGLIDDILTADELVTRILAQAVFIIRGRLGLMVDKLSLSL